MAAVTLSNINKSYGNGVPVVHGINLEIKDGEFMVLVGPSGCGKSTTLRMIAGLEDITGGELKIGGQVVNDIAPKDRKIAMVFQNYALYPHMSVYENIAFGLKLAKFSKTEIENRVQAVAKTLEIQPLLQRKPKDMSGGQRQRVALGRAIARRAEVYLFDEPLSNLDAQLRVSMRVRLAQLHSDLKAQGLSHTMVYVTHDQTEAMTLGHRICVMEAGHIRQVDTPLNLYKYPKNRFVAEFIGSPAMNFINVPIFKEGGRYFMIIQRQKIALPLEKSTYLEPYVGKEVGLGVRAEHINVFDSPTEGAFEAPISVAEHMGNEDFIYFSMGQGLWVVRTSNHFSDLLSGKKLFFKIDPSEIHLFDLATEQNIVLAKSHPSAGQPDYFHILQLLEGKENIIEVSHCISRIRLTLRNGAKIQREKLYSNPAVIFPDENHVHILAGGGAAEASKLFKDS